jgi:phage gp36-like protein
MSKTRSVDVSKMEVKQVEDLSAQIGAKITSTLKKPMEEVERFLAVYGLEIEFGYNVKVKESSKDPLPTE